MTPPIAALFSVGVFMYAESQVNEQTHEVWLRVITCIEGARCPSAEIVGKEPKLSRASCEADARLIAHMMSLDGNRYGYRCIKSDYEPPKMPDGPVRR